MTTVHLVRHGAHDLVGRRLCGRTPGIDIGAEGRAQAQAVAEALARRLAGRGAARVVTSPLSRARQTAEPISRACGAPLEEEAAVTEIDFGEWTGRDFADLDPLPDWRRWNAHRDQARPPGGESMSQVQARLAAWLEEMAKDDRVVVAVSHADVIKAAVCLALGLSMRSHDRFQIDPASITTLSAEPGRLTLLRLNEIAHG